MLSLRSTFNYIFGNSASQDQFKKIEKFEFKDKISKDSYLNIKNNFKSFALATRAVREEAVRNKGQIRYNLRVIKKDIGQYARTAHIALSFLRGRLYSEVEPNTKDPISIDILKDYLKWTMNYKYVISEQYKKDLNRFFGVNNDIG